MISLDERRNLEKLRRDRLSFKEQVITTNNNLKSEYNNASFSKIIKIEELLEISKKTAFVNEIRENFYLCNYEKAALSIDKHCAHNKMPAIDIAVISAIAKIPEFESIIESELVRKIKRISQYSISELVKDSEIIFLVGDKRFETKKASCADCNAINYIVTAKISLSSLSSDEEIFTVEELTDFVKVLADNPISARNKETGRKIYSFLEGLINSGEKTVCLQYPLYYHGRGIRKGIIPTKELMRQAPTGMANPGRYNGCGQSHYYFSNNEEGAVNEIKKHQDDNPEESIWVAEINPKSIIQPKIIDFSGSLRRGKNFLDSIKCDADTNKKMPSQYLIPQYVANCCKEIGFDGIKYYGNKRYNNYVVWKDNIFEVKKIYEY